jgi:hypothetical protein
VAVYDMLANIIAHHFIGWIDNTFFYLIISPTYLWRNNTMQNHTRKALIRLIAGLPESTNAPLQPVQNAAARLIFQLRLCDHVSANIIQLHWLPIRHRVTYTLCELMLNVNAS